MTVFAGEGPRFVVDQLAREPGALAASLAAELEHVASVRQRLAWDALLVLGPEHARVFREAGWSREQLQDELHRLTHPPAGELVRGAGGIAEGLDPRRVTDPAVPVAKFAAADRILLGLRGRRRRAVQRARRRLGVGRAGLRPADGERGAMALTILDPTAERDPAGRPLAARSGAPGTVGLLDIRKPRGDVFLDEVEAGLRSRGIAVLRETKPTYTKPAPVDLRRAIAERCDAVIEALAD